MAETTLKELLGKTGKGVDSRKKNRLLLERLEKIDADGTLSSYTSRAEVAKALGYTSGKGSGYIWVMNRINEGRLSETIRGFSPNGKSINEYYYIKPSLKAETTKPVAPFHPDTVYSTPEVEPETKPQTVELVISVRGADIKIKADDAKQAVELVSLLVEKLQ